MKGSAGCGSAAGWAPDVCAIITDSWILLQGWRGVCISPASLTPGAGSHRRQLVCIPVYQSSLPPFRSRFPLHHYHHHLLPAVFLAGALLMPGDARGGPLGITLHNGDGVKQAEEVRLEWDSGNMSAYQLQESAELDQWQDFGEVMVGTGGPMRYVLPTEGRTSRFFRMKSNEPQLPDGAAAGPFIPSSFFVNQVPGYSAGEWNTLDPEPPLITMSPTYTPEGAVDFQPFSKGLPTEAISCFNFYGAEWRVAKTSGSLWDYCGYATITGQYLALKPACEFLVDTKEFAVSVYGAAGTTSVQFWVDGKRVGGPVFASRSDALYYCLSFPDDRVRLIRMEINNGNFGRVRTAGWGTVSQPPGTKKRVIVVGDSFTEGAGVGSYEPWSGYAGQLARKTGWDVWQSGAGGTGYVNPGTGRVPAPARVGTDAIAHAPEMIIWAMGINDAAAVYYADDKVYAAALACFSAVKLALPECQQVVVGPWWSTGSPTADVREVSAQVQRAAAEMGLMFIPTLAAGSEFITRANQPSYHGRSTHAATGTSVLEDGAVASVRMTAAGGGYQSRPSVTFSGGGGGTGATGVVQVTGRIQSCTVFTGGLGYVAPVVEFIGGGGSGAAATAVVRDGIITEITITDEGSGYTSEPVVSITDEVGRGAIAVAAQTNKVTGVEITNGGSGYLTPPSVSFGAPTDGTHPGLPGHAYYAERLYYELYRRAR